MIVVAGDYPFKSPIIFRNNRKLKIDWSPAMTLEKIILSLECETFEDDPPFSKFYYQNLQRTMMT